MFCDAAAVLSQHSDRYVLVQDDADLVPLRQSNHLRQRTDVALVQVQALDDDKVTGGSDRWLSVLRRVRDVKKELRVTLGSRICSCG